LQYRARPTGQPVKPGTELRILPVGDSITVGFESNDMEDGVTGDGNGYRLELRNDLAKDNVVFAGTVESAVGTMADGWFAAWSGKTIQYIADHVGDSLQERPNIILLHAGTNDMNQDTNIATEGNDPVAAVGRLSSLISQMLEVNPSAVIVVAMIINVCSDMAFQKSNTNKFNSLIPNMVYTDFASNGHHVLTADFSTFLSDTELQDCVHPTAITGYHLLGDYWYDFVSQIPSDWIEAPEGPDPIHTGGANGGLTVLKICSGPPKWYPTGEIALGVGHLGAWKYAKNWVQAGEVASGIQSDAAHTGMIVCWLNNLLEPWSPAGTNHSIIGSGAGPADSVFIADMNGDGLEDYIVVDPDSGAVNIWWNWGPDDNWVNGWKFAEGGQIASGVHHANWDTLRFPDINGDGRADYVVVGEGGALLHYMNTGTVGGTDVLFLAQGGIATGAVSNITTLVFADVCFRRYFPPSQRF
ncbi:family 3 carbohydrate esterase, partial [Coniochaeta ligniaria NRRL 30616]